MPRHNHIAVIYHRGDMDGFFSGHIIKLGLEYLFQTNRNAFATLNDESAHTAQPLKVHMFPLEYTDPLPSVPVEVIIDNVFGPVGADNPVDVWANFHLIFVVDMSRSDLFASAAVRPEIVWIDHHDTAIKQYADVVDEFHGVFCVNKVAACRLCFQFMRLLIEACDGEVSATKGFNLFGAVAHISLLASDPFSEAASRPYREREVKEPIPIRMIGEYDVFDLRDPDARILQHGIRTVSKETIARWIENMLCEDDTLRPSEIFPGMSDGTQRYLQYLLERGQAVQSYVDDQVNFYAQFSTTVVLEGVRFCVLNLLVGNSFAFGKCFDPSKHDACLMWRHISADKVLVSLYSDNRYPTQHHLGNIAKKFGGGGHAGAAGFTTTLPWICGLLSKAV